MVKLPRFFARICELNCSCIGSYNSSRVVNKSSQLNHTTTVRELKLLKWRFEDSHFNYNKLDPHRIRIAWRLCHRGFPFLVDQRKKINETQTRTRTRTLVMFKSLFLCPILLSFPLFLYFNIKTAYFLLIYSFIFITSQFNVLTFFSLQVCCMQNNYEILEYLSRGGDEDYRGIFSNYFLNIFPFFLMWNDKKWCKFPVFIC